MTGKPYLNGVPPYEWKVSDEEILAALSRIKSTGSDRIKRQQDQINTRANARIEGSVRCLKTFY